MDPAGLLNSILSAAASIDKGRRYLAADSFEHVGRLSYEYGISLALTTFKKAQGSVDPQIMILIELTYLQQDLQFCDENDSFTRSSLTQAIQSFEDALRSLVTVENRALYKAAETTYPKTTKYRYHGLPRDAVHLACAAHRTRLQNSLRTPGINMIEKTVLAERAANMVTIQAAYAEKQRIALEEKQEERETVNL
ncbi:MAG: hypothetical protein FWC45_05080 [Treponema sp.]|nr:hypothetical protein [Treponema sp.]